MRYSGSVNGIRRLMATRDKGYATILRANAGLEKSYIRDNEGRSSECVNYLRCLEGYSRDPEIG